MHHKHYWLGLYTYASRNRKHAWWTRTNVLDHFAPKEYVPEALELLPLHERDIVARFPFEIQGWKDRRGEDAKVWDDLRFDPESVRLQTKPRMEEGFAEWFY